MPNPVALTTQQVPGGPTLLRPAGMGKVFYVDSNGGGSTTSGGLSPETAFTTLDSAINACTASKGDTIYVMPGHAESGSAADLWDADVAGIAIIGLGWGAKKPSFTFADTDTTVAIGASSVWVENLRFIAGISAVVVGVDVEATTAIDFTMKDCDFIQGATTGYDFVDSVIVRSAAHRARFSGCRFLAEPAVAGAATAIKIAGAASNVRIENCEFMGDYSTACVNQTTPLCQGLMFLNNLVHNTDAGEPYLEVTTGTTGVIANTRGLAKGATIAANAVADAMAHCENFVVNTAGTAAILVGAGGAPVLDVD